MSDAREIRGMEHVAEAVTALIDDTIRGVPSDRTTTDARYVDFLLDLRLEVGRLAVLAEADRELGQGRPAAWRPSRRRTPTRS
jgi:hypothetical protein